MGRKSVIIGISGPSGSGKSLLATTIVEELSSNRVAVISEDSYYKCQKHLPFEERGKKNFDHPDSLDHALLTQHLAILSEAGRVQVPRWNHMIHGRDDGFTEVGPSDIIVLEGILLLYDKSLRHFMDVKIFMDTPLDICLIRRLRRDITERCRTSESILRQYEETVRPMYFEFIEPSKRHADVAVLHGGRNRPAIDIIKAKIREHLTTIENQ